MILSAKELNEIVEAVVARLEKKFKEEIERVACELIDRHEDDFEHKEKLLTVEEIIAEKEA